MKTMIRRECLAGYDEGVLKALVDGELSAVWRDEVRAHAGGCRACSERVMELRGDGALVMGRLHLLSGARSASSALTHETGPAMLRPPVAEVLALARQCEAAPVGWWERAMAFGRSLPSIGPVRPRPLAGALLGASALLAVSFSQPAVQSFAQGVVQSLRVQRVQPISIDPALLKALRIGHPADVAQVGTYRGPAEPRIRAATGAEASRSTGLTLRAPTNLPAALRSGQPSSVGSPLIYVSEAESFSVTYDGQKLVQAAQELGVGEAALLNDLRALNGVTVRGNVPSAAVLFFGTPPVGDTTAKDVRSAATQAPAGPFLGFLQMKSPTLDVPATVNADKLRDQLLRSGALPPQLANQLLAIQDWKTTLPIPVTRGTATQAAVDGVTGTLVVGEAAPGIGPLGAVSSGGGGPIQPPMLIWQKDGALYVLAGTVSESELLAAARSLQALR